MDLSGNTVQLLKEIEKMIDFGIFHGLLSTQMLNETFSVILKQLILLVEQLSMLIIDFSYHSFAKKSQLGLWLSCSDLRGVRKAQCHTLFFSS